ncbi:MDR family MFS transporter [Undibacterium sp.]|uniref:MDR family MFS transporter n=1 Tax=Undibacterium sp. TaxID=1914977 RepID=UPI00374DF4E0
MTTSSISRQDGELSHRAIMTIMVPLMLVLFISTLDQTVVATALHGIGQALGDTASATWVATAYLLTSAVTTLIFGKLGDMTGRKPVFQASVAIFVAGSVLCAMAPSMLWLIVFRAIQGIGGGGLNSLVMAIVGDLIPARQRAQYQSLMGIVPAIAIIIGPMLGGFIVERWSWPWIFLINVPIGITAFIIIARKLHLPTRSSEHRIDLAGGMLATVFTSAFLLLSVCGGQVYPWLSWQIAALACTTVTACIIYIWVERRAAEPVTPLHLFSNRIFTASLALFFLSAALLFISMLFVPMMLQMVFGMSAFRAGACIIPLLLGLIIAAMVSGSLIARNGRYKRYPVIGALLCGGGMHLLSRIGAETPVWMILVLLAIIGIGVGLFIQVTVLAGQNAVDAKDLGVATGALNYFKNIGGAAGAAVFGAILASAMPGQASAEQLMAAFEPVYAWAAWLMLPALILAVRMEEKPLSEQIIEIAEGKLEVPEY